MVNNERIAADMNVLSKIPGRFAGSEGERAILHAVRERLPGGLAGRIEGFVAHVAPSLVLGLHDLCLVLAGILGFWKPHIALAFAAVTTLSLMAEGAGKTSLFRWMLPKWASYNLVVRRKAESALGTVIFAAPLDAPGWRFSLPWVRGQRAMRVTFAAAITITVMLLLRSLGETGGPRTREIYVVSLIILALGFGLGLLAHRRQGSGVDEASGPAALLELMRQFRDRPIPGVDLWFAFTGCGRAYQGGMEAFLQLHQKTLVDPVLVISFDDPGRPPLQAAVAEGPLFPQHHRPTGPALVERLSWAGVMISPVDRVGISDARAALNQGYRAIGLVGGEGTASPEATRRAAEVAETMARWFGDDLARVADNRTALQELARSTTESATPIPVLETNEPKS